MHFALLISQRADAAYFGRTMDVATAELSSYSWVGEIETRREGDLNFLCLEADEERLQDLLRLSFVHGAFRIENETLSPINAAAGFKLHPDFVWGEKYKGKTNETLTQLLINTGLQHLDETENVTLLDPMAGRGTTLLWAMRYGINSVGIEQDGTAIENLRRGLKKWSKLHRQPHDIRESSLSKTRKKKVSAGRFLEFRAEDTTLRLIIGDTTETASLLSGQHVNIIATDIPYGVQHRGSAGTRSPLETIQAAATGWVDSLKPGGVMVVSFNNYMPRRKQMIAAFEDLPVDPVETQLQHRMSESIVRDVLVLRKTGS